MTQQIVERKVSYAEEVESEARLRKRIAVARRQIRELLEKRAEGTTDVLVLVSMCER